MRMGIVVWYTPAGSGVPCAYAESRIAVIEGLGAALDVAKRVAEELAGRGATVCEVRIYNLSNESELRDFCEEIEYEHEVCEETA